MWKGGADVVCPSLTSQRWKLARTCRAQRLRRSKRDEGFWNGRRFVCARGLACAGVDNAGKSCMCSYALDSARALGRIKAQQRAGRRSGCAPPRSGGAVPVHPENALLSAKEAARKTQAAESGPAARVAPMAAEEPESSPSGGLLQQLQHFKSSSRLLNCEDRFCSQEILRLDSLRPIRRSPSENQIVPLDGSANRSVFSSVAQPIAVSALTSASAKIAVAAAAAAANRQSKACEIEQQAEAVLLYSKEIQRLVRNVEHSSRVSSPTLSTQSSSGGCSRGLDARSEQCRQEVLQAAKRKVIQLAGDISKAVDTWGAVDKGAEKPVGKHCAASTHHEQVDVEVASSDDGIVEQTSRLHHLEIDGDRRSTSERKAYEIVGGSGQALSKCLMSRSSSLPPDNSRRLMAELDVMETQYSSLEEKVREALTLCKVQEQAKYQSLLAQQLALRNDQICGLTQQLEDLQRDHRLLEAECLEMREARFQVQKTQTNGNEQVRLVAWKTENEGLGDDPVQNPRAEDNGLERASAKSLVDGDEHGERIEAHEGCGDTNRQHRNMQMRVAELETALRIESQRASTSEQELEAKQRECAALIEKVSNHIAQDAKSLEGLQEALEAEQLQKSELQNRIAALRDIWPNTEDDDAESDLLQSERHRSIATDTKVVSNTEQEKEEKLSCQTVVDLDGFLCQLRIERKKKLQLFSMHISQIESRHEEILKSNQETNKRPAQSQSRLGESLSARHGIVEVVEKKEAEQQLGTAAALNHHECKASSADDCLMSQQQMDDLNTVIAAVQAKLNEIFLTLKLTISAKEEVIRDRDVGISVLQEQLSVLRSEASEAKANEAKTVIEGAKEKSEFHAFKIANEIEIRSLKRELDLAATREKVLEAAETEREHRAQELKVKLEQIGEEHRKRLALIKEDYNIQLQSQIAKNIESRLQLQTCEGELQTLRQDMRLQVEGLKESLGVCMAVIGRHFDQWEQLLTNAVAELRVVGADANRAVQCDQVCNKLEAKLTSYQVQIRQLEKNAQKLNETNAQHSRAYAACQCACESSNRRIVDLEGRLEAASAALTESERVVSETRAENEDVKTNLSKMQDIIDDRDGALVQSAEELRAARESDREWESERLKLGSLVSTTMQKKLHEEKRYAAEEKASYVMEAEKGKAECLCLQKKADEQQELVAQLQMESRSLCSKVKKLEEEVSALESALAKSSEHSAWLHVQSEARLKDLCERERELSAVQAELVETKKVLFEMRRDASELQRIANEHDENFKKVERERDMARSDRCSKESWSQKQKEMARLASELKQSTENLTVYERQNKDLKKTLKSKTDEIVRLFKVLSAKEERASLSADGPSTPSTISNTSKRVEKLTAEVAGLKSSLDGSQAREKGMQERLGEMQERLLQMEARAGSAEESCMLLQEEAEARSKALQLWYVQFSPHIVCDFANVSVQPTKWRVWRTEMTVLSAARITELAVQPLKRASWKQRHVILSWSGQISPNRT